MNNLTTKHCQPCEGGIPPLTKDACENLKQSLDNTWQITQEYKAIEKNFTFKNYYQTIAFVNAIAWIAHQEDHHPDLEVGYNHCLVRFSTHAIGGLSENDFICAAKIDTLK